MSINISFDNVKKKMFLENKQRTLVTLRKETHFIQIIFSESYLIGYTLCEVTNACIL